MIESITTLGAFERLGDDWRSLQSRSASGSPFLTWDWLFTWWKHLSAARRLMILAVRKQGRLTAIAPLAIRPPCVPRLIPFRALELLGTGTVGSDYLDLIVEQGAEEEAIPEIAAHLGTLRMPLELPHVLLDNSSARLLADRLAPQGWRVKFATTNVCPYIALGGLDWPAYVASLGSAHRTNLQRRIHGLERIGPVRLDAVQTEAERREALDRLIALHIARWRPLGGSDAFHVPEMLHFHHELSGLALRDGWLRLMVLRVGQTPVAWFYGFRRGTTFYFYQSAFDPAWSDRSVGLVAMGLAIRSAIEEGAADFDMLHGGERYKHHWARAQRSVGRMDLHPPFLRGRVTSGVAELGRMARAMGRGFLRAPGGEPHA
ncbi:MAG TPA: GNAT family N-acetyltransferase [Patescibacteria group bacterium]|nr:GNAT family N-acetyltransferase [Patescibacteria group bacterium]